MIIIRCHPWEHRFVLEQGAEVVDRTAQEEEACVQRLVRDVLCGVVEIFVGVFDVAQQREVGFEAVAAQRNYLVIDFLGAVVRGAYWKPILYVRQQGVLYRLPDFGRSSFGIVRNYAFRNGGFAAMNLALER